MDPFLWLLVWHVEAEYINCALGLRNVQNPILDTRTQNKQELRKENCLDQHAFQGPVPFDRILLEILNLFIYLFFYHFYIKNKIK
jgi:hypothetical protein